MIKLDHATKSCKSY
jgi:hypothetical protein